MAALATLSVDLTAKLAQFEGDMGKAARASEKASADIVRSFGQIKAVMGALTAGITFHSIIELGRATINSVDALNDLKDATGASIENISALEDIAARTGTKFEGVQTSLIKFNAALKDAKPNSDAEAAFKALNLNIAELQALDPADALLKTAMAMSGFADDGNKARLTQELFGKSLKEVAPFLKDLAEKGQLVATVTTDQAEAAERFNKQLFEVEKNSQDAKRALLETLLPALSQIVAQFTVGTKTAGGFFAAILNLGTTNPFNSLSENVEKYRDQIAELEADKARYLRSNSDTRAIDEALVMARKRLAYFTELRQLQNNLLPSNNDQSAAEARRLGLQVARPSVGVVKAVKPAKPEKPDTDTTNKDLQSYVESLEKASMANQQLTEVERARYFLENKGAGANEPQRELILSLAERIDKEKELTEILKQKREAATADGDAVAKANEQYQATLKRLIDATPAAKLEAQRADVQLLTDELEAGRLSEAQYLEAVSARLDLTSEKVTHTKSAAEELGLTFSSAFEDAVLGGKELSDVLDGLMKDIARIALRKTITEPIGNFISGAVTSSLGSLFSFDGGGYTGPGSRVGGMDGRGGFMAMLHPNETVVDHTKGQSAGGGQTIINNFTVGDVASVSMVRQALAASQRQMMGAMQRSQVYA